MKSTCPLGSRTAEARRVAQAFSHTSTSAEDAGARPCATVSRSSTLGRSNSSPRTRSNRSATSESASSITDTVP